MTPAPFAVLASLLLRIGGPEVLPLPPEPPGAQAVPVEPAKPVAEAKEPAAAADSDDSDSSPEGEAQSEEMEELRALEEVELNPSARPSAEELQAIRRLGVGNPLRHRIQEAYDESDLREDLGPTELPRITDLAQFDVGVVKDEYDIPVEMQPLVAQYIHFFQGPGRKWFRHWMGRSTRFIPLMQPILEKHGLPKDTVYLAMIESGFSVDAYSWARAAGPWQFISGTGKTFGLKQDFWLDERRDPIKSTVAASKFLSQLHDDLGDWELAWAAYNTGGNRVRRVMDKKGTSDFWQLSDGKGLAKETKHYVPKLIACALVAKHPKAFGFSDDEFDYLPLFEFEEVKVTAPTDLEIVARAAGASVAEIKELNPELRRWCTPPATEQKPYTLRVPKGHAAQFAENFAKLAPSERLNFAVHRVQRGDTLSLIAAKYHSAPEAIMQINRLKSVRALRVNSDLVIPVPSSRSIAQGATDPGLERQVAKARRSGFAAVRPEEEIPAGTRQKAIATGPIKTEVIGGKTKVTYSLQEGDNLWTVAQHFNCTVEDLKHWNQLGKHARRMQIGTVLEIWPGVPGAVENRGGTLIAQKAPLAASGTAVGNRYTLAAGDTLWSIAQKYGVTVEDIKRWNGITNHRAVKAGQEITVAAPP